MDFDISHLLEDWDYKPGQVVVRKFNGKDGKDRIQLRVDLGLLQLNAEGRPDGKHPFGHESLFEYYQMRLCKHLASDGGTVEEFKLKPEDYSGVVRDAERNLAVFEFVGKHAESEELAWSLRQFQPQLLMILTRARTMQAMDAGDYAGAIGLVEQGLEQIRDFYRERSKPELMDQSGEIHSLETWLAEIRANRPLSAREKLEQALSEAIRREDYERAAQMRDALRSLKSKC
jgi:ABC-type cobalt transport system substrate-binding protein